MIAPRRNRVTRSFAVLSMVALAFIGATHSADAAPGGNIDRARPHLRQAHAALDAGDYEAARALAERAQTAAPQWPEPALLLTEIDAANAAALAQQAREFAGAGKFAQAAAAASRAAELQPGDEQLALLPSQIDLQAREARFDAMAVDSQQLLDAGKVVALQRRIGELRGLGVRQERLESLQQQFAERRSAIDAELTAARAARDAGDFDAALSHYAAARGLASDDSRLDDETSATEADQRVDALVRQGQTAMDSGDYLRAVDVLGQAMDLRADPEIDAMLTSAQVARHRQELQSALADDNLPAAIGHARAALNYQADNELSQMLGRLQQEFADRALSEAMEMDAAGHTENAVGVLTRAMSSVSDLRLRDLAAQLKSERLVQLGVEAEQKKRFPQARKFYLDALAAGGDRAGIAQRISDIEELSELSIRLDEASAHAAQLDAELQSCAAEQDELVRALHDRERELQLARNDVQQLNAELNRVDYHHNELESRVHDLQHEVNCLRGDLAQCQREVDIWRHRYEDACRQRDHEKNHKHKH